jgi:hypothetical protein
MGCLPAAVAMMTLAEAEDAWLGHRGETAARCPNGASGRSAVTWMVPAAANQCRCTPQVKVKVRPPLQHPRGLVGAVRATKPFDGVSAAKTYRLTRGLVPGGVPLQLLGSRAIGGAPPSLAQLPADQVHGGNAASHSQLVKAAPDVFIDSARANPQRRGDLLGL